MSTRLFDTYQTDGSANPITLKIQIGNAQLGVSSVIIDGNQLITAAADPNGNYDGNFALELGTNVALQGKTLEIVPTVELVQVPTASSIIIELDGGAGPHVYALQNAAGAAQNTSIDYYASISFI